MCPHEEEIPFPADADRAVRRRGGADGGSGPRAHGTDLVSGTQPRHRAPHLAEDAAGRRHDFSWGWRARSPPAACAWSVAHLIANRYVDCLVSTGANLYHDLHETRGQHHYVGSPHADDAALAEDRIDRVYDTYASEEEFCSNDNWIADFAATLETRPYTTREFLHLLGGHLWKTTGRDGILTAAYRANVPIFCPAIADSSIGMGLSQARQKKAGAGYIDIIGDIVESANLVIRRPRTASVVLGGGTPKNFINQASVQAEFYSDEVGGHRYALQIVTDVPHFGGASGSSLEEAQSWGKLATDSARVSVQADATIALPLLVERAGDDRAAAARQRVKTGVHAGRPRHDHRRPDRSVRALRGSE